MLFHFFFLMPLAETANKSNVVTASTAIQLLDDRKSPVVAGKVLAVYLFCSCCEVFKSSFCIPCFPVLS